jgi:immunomodulating metalloprotease
VHSYIDRSIDPTGWGEAHELGHNMQVQPFNIHYPNDGTHNLTMWSDSTNTVTEASNNIFPYYVK